MEASGAPAAAEPNGNGAEPPPGLIDLDPETPSELRPILEQYIQEKVSPQVNRKFQEAAQLREQYGKFADVEGLHDFEPDQVGELLDLARGWADPQYRADFMANEMVALAEQDPELVEEMWRQLGEHLDYFDVGDEDGEEDEALGSDPRVDQHEATIQQLQERLEAAQAEAQQQQAEQRINQEIDRQFGKLEKEHGELDEEAKEEVMAIAAHLYSGDEDFIEKAFGRWQQRAGQAQTELLKDKLENAPPNANRGGQSDTAPETLSFGGSRLNEVATARLRAGDGAQQ